MSKKEIQPQYFQVGEQNVEVLDFLANTHIRNEMLTFSDPKLLGEMSED